MNSPKYYYHITSRDWGDKVILSPREFGNLRDPFEPYTSRICVSDSILGCFSAVDLSYFMIRCNIYRTKNKVVAKNPYRVCDSRITGEKWLVKDTEFVFVGSLSKEITSEINEEVINKKIPRWIVFGNPDDKDLQRLYKKELKKFFSEKNIPIRPMKLTRRLDNAYKS